MWLWGRLCMRRVTVTSRQCLVQQLTNRVLAGRAFWGSQRLPLPMFQVHLRGSSVSLWGQGLTDYMFLPFVIQAWNSSAATPTQSHCEQGCSPQPGAFKGNESPPFRCAKLPDQYGFPQILQRGLFLCLICQRPASGI